MRLGVIARPEDRGLGLQTWEVTRHLQCSVLVVDVLEQRTDIASHWDRFPDAVRAVWRHGKFLKPRLVGDWLESVDVVYSAETFYDQKLPDWAYAVDTRTVVQVNPEFWRPTRWREPDAQWSATSWRLEHIAPGTEVVPYPVAAERFTPVPQHDGPTRWLHVAGRRAIYDRNGTETLLEALPLLRQPCSVTIAVQDGDEPPQLPRVPRYVDVQVRGPVANYWDQYADADALVMPRRYGGLCMPVQEACAAGLAILMPDCAPNRDTWPIVPVRVHGYDQLHMRAGEVAVANVDHMDLARQMDALAEPCKRHVQQQASLGWATWHSWQRQGPDWLERFQALRER